MSMDNRFIHERTFPAWYLEAWARRGIFPPPLHGDPRDLDSVFFHLACQDLWDPEGPSLTVSDEEGVELQRAACEASMRTIPSRTTPIPGTFSLIIGPARD